MRVLVAVDSSEIAAGTFEWYVRNAHKEENTVFVYHEAHQPNLPSMMFAGAQPFPREEVDKILLEHQRKRDELKDCYMKKCGDYKIANYEVIVDTTRTNVGHGILKKADSIGAELIVIGTRGSGMLRRSIFGSISHYVLHHTKLPVLICHKQHH